MTKELKESVFEYVESHKEEMISKWEEMVRLESYSRDFDSVNSLAEHLKAEFEEEGLQCEIVDVGNNGNSLVGTLGADRGGKPIVFSGHFDTVIPAGTYEELFKIQDGFAYGPGALDMKGGIIIALYVIKALNSIGYDKSPLKIVFLGDEEIGHFNSTAEDLILNESKGALCAFNMETGLTDNAICVGRKGRQEVYITVEGVESHAGNDFLSGRNAIEEMAYKIIELQKLTNMDTGTTVSVGTIQGGTVSNAIPSKCKIELDVRFEKVSEMEGVKKQIEEICSKTYIEGTTTELEFVAGMAAFETTDMIMNFYDFFNRTAVENGFGEMGSRRLGGSSDASYIAIAGVPVLCSLGVQGKWNHTTREYAVVDSLFERTKLISTVILNLDNFNNKEA